MSQVSEGGPWLCVYPPGGRVVFVEMFVACLPTHTLKFWGVLWSLVPPDACNLGISTVVGHCLPQSPPVMIY